MSTSIPKHSRGQKGAILAALAAALSMHPLNFPPIKIDLHFSVDMRPAAIQEGPAKSHE